MKAIVYTRYGTPDVMALKDVEKPAPKTGDVLVKVYAASVNAADWHLLTADIFLVRLFAGLLKPGNPILGADVAGVVEAVGEGVTRFSAGDAVFGDIFEHGSGSFAEYVCAPERTLELKPANLSFEQAAAVPLAAMTALCGLRDNGQLRPGQKALINGASGGVGSFAVQLAKYLGAHVTAVCSTRNQELARSLGADEVIDYSREDFTRSGQLYDLIFAANGYHPIADYARALAPQGIYVMAGGSAGQMAESMTLGAMMTRKNGKKFGALTLKPTLADLTLLRSLLETGRLAPVMDRSYPLAETPEALRYLGLGHARGKIVISVNGAGK